MTLIGFSGVSVVQSFVDHCLSFCPFFLSLLAITLTVLLRITALDYPFDIFKFLLNIIYYGLYICEFK